MTNPKIVPVRIGYSNSFLIVNSCNSILIDTGVKTKLQRFRILFKENGLSPDDIKLIILTHTHYDHTGNLKSLAKLTGAKVIVHANEFGNLKNGFTPIPRGLSFNTRLISELGRFFYPKYASPKAFTADFTNKNEFDLSAYDLDAKIISTPGHTAGSQSVLMGNKIISGDTFIHLRNGIIFPHFADDPQTLLKTWQYLFDLGIYEIFPGHGPNFNTEKAFPEFEKWKKRIFQKIQ